MTGSEHKAASQGDVRDAIRISGLCHELDDVAVERLLKIAVPQDYRAREQIFGQGSAANAIYLPCSGSQMVERSVASGQRQVLAFLQRGHYLGFSTSSHYVNSAYTLEASCILRFASQDFFSLAEDYPALRDNIGRISNQVLERVLDHLFAIGQKRAHERVAFLLCQLYAREKTPTEDLLLKLPMRRSDIGDYLGLTLETTSRAFSRLRKDALIDVKGRDHVQILDKEALEALAEVK